MLHFTSECIDTRKWHDNRHLLTPTAVFHVTKLIARQVVGTTFAWIKHEISNELSARSDFGLGTMPGAYLHGAYLQLNPPAVCIPWPTGVEGRGGCNMPLLGRNNGHNGAAVVTHVTHVTRHRRRGTTRRRNAESWTAVAEC